MSQIRIQHRAIRVFFTLLCLSIVGTYSCVAQQAKSDTVKAKTDSTHIVAKAKADSIHTVFKTKLDSARAITKPKADSTHAVSKTKSDSIHIAAKRKKFLSFLGKIFHNPLNKPAINNPISTPSGKRSDSLAAAGALHKEAGGIPSISSSTQKKNPADTGVKQAVKSDSAASNPHKSFLSKLTHTTEHGSLSFGYDYGVLPFASDLQVPMGYFHSEGQGQLNLGSLPFNCSYYYSDLGSISGLNNYFRISFDAQKFKQEYMDKAGQEEGAIKSKLMQAYKDRQVAEQKLLYLKSIDGQGVQTPAVPTSPSVSSPGNPVQTNALPNASGLSKDESLVEKAGADSLKKDAKPDSANASKNNIGSVKSDSTALAKSAKASLLKNDSTKIQMAKYAKDVDKYDKLIEKLERDLHNVDKTAGAMEQNNPYMSKLYNIMGGVKKFDVGLCYPDYSTFLLNGTAVKGINVEYKKDDVYIAATEGTTVNTLLFTNNSLQNHLVNMQNLYNMFDFNSVQNGRKIVAGKIGVGEKEGTHFYVGMLYGSGLPSYISGPSAAPVTTDGISKNVVLELDGMVALTKNMTINMVYGKSSTQSAGPGYSTTDGGVFSSLQSKAVMGKYKWNIARTRTTLTLTGRWIDPYFNSFGIGYLRADNFRYEAKADQALGKKIKFSLFVRKDEDDVLRLYEFHTVLQTIGTNATIKLMRSLTFRVGYSPVIEHMTDATNPQYDILNHNYICNALLTYAPVMKGINTMFNLSYNYYKLTNDTQTVNFTNFSFSNTTRFKNSLSNNISVNWFKTTPQDSLNNDVWMFSDEVGFTFAKGFRVSVGGKAAYSPWSENWRFGYVVKVSVPLVKHLSCDLMAEKLVLGDFYNSFDIQQIEKFPYFCQGKIIYSW